MSVTFFCNKPIPFKDIEEKTDLKIQLVLDGGEEYTIEKPGIGWGLVNEFEDKQLCGVKFYGAMEGLVEIMNTLSDNFDSEFLNMDHYLKKYGGEGESSFPIPIITLTAEDFPVRKDSDRFMSLDDL